MLRDDRFAELVDRLTSGASDCLGEESALDVIKYALDDVYISSDQGVLLLDIVEDEFDKTDCACFLHSRMLNQNHFRVVVDRLHKDSIQNIWHKILGT